MGTLLLINGQVLAHGSWLMAEAGPGPGPTTSGADLGATGVEAPRHLGPALAMNHDP